MRFRFITFLTDFGLQDDFVGTCHGVIKRIAPEVEIIDITHGIEPRRLLQGALTLADTIPYMPVGVHLAVVDPGVGTDRRAIALEDKSGRVYVGPDNGLLLPVAERMGGIASAPIRSRTASTRWRRSRRPSTAATSSRRRRLTSLSGYRSRRWGQKITVPDLVRLAIPKPETRRGRSQGGGRRHRSLRQHAAQSPPRPTSSRLGIAIGSADRDRAQRRALLRRSRPVPSPMPGAGDIMLYEDSFQNSRVAISGGDAATMFGAEPGDKISFACSRASGFPELRILAGAYAVSRLSSRCDGVKSALEERSRRGNTGPDVLFVVSSGRIGSGSATSEREKRAWCECPKDHLIYGRARAECSRSAR